MPEAIGLVYCIVDSVAPPDSDVSTIIAERNELTKWAYVVLVRMRRYYDARRTSCPEEVRQYHVIAIYNFC